MKQPQLLLVDGNNLLFRSFHAIKDMSTSAGVPTNAVYGTLKSLRATIQTFKPEYIIVCWDSGKKTFRHEQDETYKAHRPAVRDDLKSQFSLVKEAIDALGIPQITADGVECDDLIGTLATKASANGMHATIISSDKDFFQLCEDNITVYSFTVRNKNGDGIVDAKYVRETFEVEPRQLVDVKSLTGEKTDNITGVRGIGPKIATKLIKQYGTIFDVIKVLRNNSTIPERYKIILESVDVIANAYTLAKIKTDVELPPDIPVLSTENLVVDEERLANFFRTYEMKSYLNEMASWKRLFTYKLTLA